jgi:RimJ/RimL family protein N-acetyltransferase
MRKRKVLLPLVGFLTVLPAVHAMPPKLVAKKPQAAVVKKAAPVAKKVAPLVAPKPKYEAPTTITKATNGTITTVAGGVTKQGTAWSARLMEARDTAPLTKFCSDSNVMATFADGGRQPNLVNNRWQGAWGTRARSKQPSAPYVVLDQSVVPPQVAGVIWIGNGGKVGTGECAYLYGKPFWGKGLAGAALKTFTDKKVNPALYKQYPKGIGATASFRNPASWKALVNAGFGPAPANGDTVEFMPPSATWGDTKEGCAAVEKDVMKHVSSTKNDCLVDKRTGLKFTGTTGSYKGTITTDWIKRS